MRIIATQNAPANEIGFLCRFIGVGLMAHLYLMAWAYMYKSQLLALLELNRRNTVMPLAEVKTFYDRAVVDYPEAYQAYTFAQWLQFILDQQLAIQYPSQMIEITHKGKDFLKYLTHWGADANTKRN